MIDMTEYFIPHSALIRNLGVGRTEQEIPEEGLHLDTDVLEGEEPLVIFLNDGRHISIEQRGGTEYIYVPNKKTVTHGGFTRLLGTNRGPRGSTEYAVMHPGFYPDGSSDRAAICVSGEEVLVYPGRPAG